MFDAHALIGRKTGVGYYTSGLVSELARQYPDDIELVGYYHNFLYRKKTPNLPMAPNIRYRRIAFMPGQVVNMLRRFHIRMPIELLTLTRADFILYPNFLGLASFFKTPSASVIHDLTFVDLPQYVSGPNLYDLRRFIPAQIRRSSFLMTVSEFCRQRIHDVFHTDPHDILVTLVPPEAPQLFSQVKQKDLLKQMGITGDFFLTLSTVEPRKNVLAAIDAFLLLPDKLQKRYTLVITGMIGWNCDVEVARLKQVKDEGRNILHLGYVTEEQRAALYQTTTFYTSTSHYEGFGMTPLEAMSYSKACALSDIAVFHEIAGDGALYFDQTKPEQIAEAWQQLLADKALRVRQEKAAKQHSNTYSWSTIAHDVYGRIMQTLGEEKR